MNGYVVLIENLRTGEENFSENSEGLIEIFVVKSKAFKRAENLNNPLQKTTVYKLTKLNNPNED